VPYGSLAAPANPDRSRRSPWTICGGWRFRWRSRAMSSRSPARSAGSASSASATARPFGSMTPTLTATKRSSD
ncbi:unnamed protein product, partial [Symbiodinium sp. CCMP2456]